MQAEPLVHVCAAAELKAAPPVVVESAADAYRPKLDAVCSLSRMKRSKRL